MSVGQDEEPLGGQDGAKGGDHKAGEQTTGPNQKLREQPKGDTPNKDDDGQAG